MVAQTRSQIERIFYQKHREGLIKQISLLEDHLKALDYKINLYKSGKVC